MKYLSIFTRVALLARGQSLDCHSASEVSLMDMGKISQCITTTKHSKTKTVCIFLGIYCISLWPCLICIFVIILHTHLQYLDGSLLQGTEDMCAISRPWDVGCLFSNLMNFKCRSWWRHQMETFSALQAVCAGNSPAIGEFPEQRPVTRGFDIFFDLRLNKRLSKQWWGWWLETQSCPLWRHRNGCCAACFISLPVLPYIGSLVHAGLLLSPLTA